jgi:hypothetical protein
MIYLLGIDHQVQHQKNTQISMAFAFYLSKKVKELDIKFIGEEWFMDLLKENSVTTTVPQGIANKYNIEHRFCDPDRMERQRIGWLSKEDDHLREKFWLNKISDKIYTNIIFICGTDHLKSFNKLLIDSGYESEILPKRFDIISYLQSQNKDL